jgi:hypothetical protein
MRTDQECLMQLHFLAGPALSIAAVAIQSVAEEMQASFYGKWKSGTPSSHGNCRIVSKASKVGCGGWAASLPFFTRKSNKRDLTRSDKLPPPAFATPILMLIAVMLAACGSGPFVSRYKLTLYVTTPTGTVVSSGVTETTLTLNNGLTKGLGGWYFASSKAEAQVIDLGPRGKLFLVPMEIDRDRRGSAAPPSAIFAELHRDVWDIPDPAEGERRLAAVADVADVPLAMLPMLVRFRDLNVPTTVELVEPDNLAKSFGPDFRIERATINITTEPVTRGVVESVMPPWFADMVQKHASLDGDTERLRRSDAPLSNRLNSKSFLLDRSQ